MKTANIALPLGLYRDLALLAEDDDRSFTSYVRRVLADHVTGAVAGRRLNELREANRR